MSAWKRALLYVRRKKGRSILLTGLLVIVMSLILLGIALNTFARGTQQKLLEEVGGYFKISMNTEIVESEYVTESLVRKIAQSDAVKGVNPMNVYYMMAPDVNLIPGEYTASVDSKAKMARILGNRDSRLNEYFYLNMFELTEGTHIIPSESGAVISEELAELNQLKVGDTIRLVITEEWARGNEAVGREFHVKIAGFFEESLVAGSSDYIPEHDINQNFIWRGVLGKRIMRT